MQNRTDCADGTAQGMEGGCLCGAIRLEITGEPLAMEQCHCRNCQKVAAGGPCHHIRVATETLRIAQGEPKVYVSPSDAGNPVSRAFCGNCGTPLYDYVFDDYRSVFAGALNDSSAFKPENVYWSASAPTWHLFPRNVQRHPKGRAK